MLKHKVSIAFTAILLIFATSTQASAVTFGKEEIDASNKFPWAVQIYYYEKNAIEPSGLCTGTLIKSDVVLTAAHCVPSEGTFEVVYGATTLEQGGTSYTVDGAWRNPRYSQSKYGVNDVGLLKLKTEIPNAKTLPLASAATLKLAEKSTVLNVYGWGEDQNGELATYLRSATVTNQSSFLSKLIGKNFNSSTWIAAGKYNKTEKVYAGGCRGDSGGPLVATYKGKPVQIGITSFGAENCETAIPTIFMKVSYFVKELLAASEQLKTNSIVTDRSPPENFVPPTINGQAKVGTVIVCQPGNWSQNVTSFSYAWTSINGTFNKSGQSLLIDSSLSGLELKCTVTGNSRAGSLDKSVQISIPSKPIVNNAAYISGLPRNGYEVASTNNLTCNGASTTGLVESSTFYWIVRNSSYETTGTNLGNTSTLTLPSTFFQSNTGKDLVCVNVITGPGGETRSQANGTIYSPQKPSVNSVQVTGVPDGYGGSNYEWIGVTATCKASSNLPIGTTENFQYSWRVYDSASPYYPTDSTPSRTIGSGQNLVLTESILKDSVLKFIGCSATISTIAGSSTGYSTRLYVDFRNIATADKTVPTFNYVSAIPYNAPLRFNDPIVLTFDASDKDSGLDISSAFSFRVVGPSSNEVSSSRVEPAYRLSGDSFSGRYEYKIMLSPIVDNLILGVHSIYIYVTDKKGNSTGWQPFTTIDIKGVRTN